MVSDGPNTSLPRGRAYHLGIKLAARPRHDPSLHDTHFYPLHCALPRYSHLLSSHCEVLCCASYQHANHGYTLVMLLPLLVLYRERTLCACQHGREAFQLHRVNLHVLTGQASLTEHTQWRGVFLRPPR
jgi:hypothetical protein